MNHDTGWVSVGEHHDTAVYGVETLGRWWLGMGRAAYPAAERLLIIADGGRSNGRRNRLWRAGSQKFADTTGLRGLRMSLSAGHERRR